MKLANINQTKYFENQRTPEWYEGFMDLRKKSHPESKLGIPDLLNQLELQIFEVTKLVEKLKWTSYFMRAYSGCSKPLRLSSYSPNISKIFVAKSGNKELGFMRLTNHFWNESSDDSNWNISEVYVKPPYRGANVATKLMKYAMTKQSAKSIFIETERYEKKKQYFNALGLTDCFSFDSTLSYVFVEGFKENMYEKFMAHIDKSEHKNEASK